MAEGNVSLTFGRGVNAAVRTRDVNVAECARGENFDLDIDLSTYRRRRAFDLIGTATNGARVNGFAQLEKADGTLSTLVQAGGTVYSWDGASSFTSVGTVSTAARLRGPREHNWTLSDKVIVTDLAKVEVLKEWDGTTFQSVAHSLGGSLYAKYCLIDNERMFLANVKTDSTDTPHVLLASDRGDYTTLDNATRSLVASALSDAFYLPIPDFKPINGLFQGLGIIGISTSTGRLYKLSGSDAFDFAIEPLYYGSAGDGDEAIVNIGNDVLIGRAGHIDSLAGTDRFGDVAIDDVERWIQPLVEDVKTWTMVYDRRLQKVFCVPDGGNVVWVLHKSVLAGGDNLSPWAKWTTTHVSSFQPTAMMAMKRPSDGIEVVYFGDSSGNIYQMDGDGGQDGGTDDIAAYRQSGLLIPVIKDAVAAPGTYDIKGYVDYVRLGSSTLTLKFEHAGTAIFDQQISINLQTSDAFSVYGGSAYYGGSFYYGDRFSGRIARQTFGAAGQSNGFQVRASITGSADFQIDEIGFVFTTR